MDAAQHSLLELEPDLESALDLTCEEKSTGFSARFLKTRKYRATHTSPGSLSSFTTKPGGDQANEFIGQIAVREGFDSFAILRRPSSARI